MNESLDILIFGAHPDDAEIGMGGTIKKHTKAGYRVGLCDITKAELSSNGSVEIRQQEAEKAREILGCQLRTNLGIPDRGITNGREHVDLVMMEIRKYQPKIVFAPYWQDRHPDHIQCSHVVQEAVFNAKLKNIHPEAKAVRVEQLFFYFINDVVEADVMLDVTEYYDHKMNSLRAYSSQFTSGNQQVRTPLNQGYLEHVEARDRLLGQKRMVEYAEGFVSKLPILIDLF